MIEAYQGKAPHKEPYTVIYTDSTAYVILLSVFENISRGDMEVIELRDFEDIVPEIIRQWLKGLEVDQCH